MADKVFVDTNALIRANVATAPLHREAYAALQKLDLEGAELWISRQVLREYIVHVTRPQTYAQPVTADVVMAQVKAFEQSFRVADETAQVTAHLLQLLKDFPVGGKQVHDANIVATMLAYGIGTLLTQNVDDMKRFASKITIVPLVQATP